MSRAELHNWECVIESLCGDNADKVLAIAQDIYNTAYVQGKNYMSLEQEDSSTNFKDELKTLVAKRLDEINHFISGCNSPFSYLQIREVQELMCDIRTTLGIDAEE